MARQKTICLALMVKNGAPTIDRCLASARSVIDYWVVVDTGSTDDTKARVRAALDGVPGALHDRPWVDYATNRTEVMALCRGKADYLLIVDADQTVEADPGFDKRALRATSYNVRLADVGFDYSKGLLLSADLRWRFVGVAHEYLVCDDKDVRAPLMTLTIREHEDDDRRSKKFTRDRDALTEALAEDPTNARYMFYLAQTLKDMGEFKKAIRWYERRVAAGGWEEEVYYAMFMRGVCAIQIGRPFAEINALLLQAHFFRPHRLEALHALIRYCQVTRRWAAGFGFGGLTTRPIRYPAQDVLFIHAHVYAYQLTDELAVCAYWIGRHQEAIALCDMALADGGDAIPAPDRARIIANREQSVQALAAVPT